jgi:hypothetical protein
MTENKEGGDVSPEILRDQKIAELAEAIENNLDDRDLRAMQVEEYNRLRVERDGPDSVPSAVRQGENPYRSYPTVGKVSNTNPHEKGASLKKIASGFQMKGWNRDPQDVDQLANPRRKRK